MSPTLHHECTRVPVTALASCGRLLVAAEGPFVRFYRARDLQYIASKRVFKAQAVHGISVYSEEHADGHVIELVIWGGQLIRALRLLSSTYDDKDDNLTVAQSDVAKATDWILDLAPRPCGPVDETANHTSTCVAVTAHNALLQIDIERKSSNFGISVTELTSSSRSILYSAHVSWESQHGVLVAAGTAFGEIIFWSWRHENDTESQSCIHRVFLGHEGSIFGVRISKELPSGCGQKLKRVIASCSDDRTIRIWDVSDLDISSAPVVASEGDSTIGRERHTGFSNEAFDATSSPSKDCLAIGWGHASRVWDVQFLDSTSCNDSLTLLSAGEDATLRTWRLCPNDAGDPNLPYRLIEKHCAAYHNGKNIWSFTVHSDHAMHQRVVCGAADAKITAHPLLESPGPIDKTERPAVYEYTAQNILSMADISPEQTLRRPMDNHKSSKKAEFFRSYCPLDEDEFLLTTNSGYVLRISLDSAASTGSISETTLIDKRADLSGYSVCSSDTASGKAFIAGSQGSIYMYSEGTKTTVKIGSVEGKVGEMFTTRTPNLSGSESIILLTTLVSQKRAELHYLQSVSQDDENATRKVAIPISDTLTGSMITSMAFFEELDVSFLVVGFRRGSIAFYSIANGLLQDNECATLFRVVDRAHGDETVTAIKWICSPEADFVGHLLSVGRNGRLAIHAANLRTNSVELVHSLILPIGPNIEGLYIQDDHLLVHGFSNKKWLLYNVKTEEEIMGVETGGAHRSWAFQPCSATLGGTLVWTRASSMHVYRRTQPSHEVVRSGGHGREIKSVAVSPDPSRRFIATGAEDTDIKIFEYTGSELTCRKTLRKHTTGIQHLQWSEDGRYLFSSGGCEEFYIWRVRPLPSFLDVGVVCEHSYAPESEHSDLRIMSFDILESSSSYTIAMVFSDSSLKVYRYEPEAALRWQVLARGIYFTSCLTQCTFLAHDRILTAGTDGHAVEWHLPCKTMSSLVGTSNAAIELSWQHPNRIHQSSSKSLDSLRLADGTLLIASGGDDGTLAFLLTKSSPRDLESPSATSDVLSPLLVSRTHASAVTACALLQYQGCTYAVTSGNDQWVRLWRIDVDVSEVSPDQREHSRDILTVKRLGKTKTSVADVSSMAVLEVQEKLSLARVLICGVGMEVIRLSWSDDGLAEI